MEMKFERTMLETYKVDTLQKLASYLGIPVRSKWTKKQIIDEIMSLQEKNDNSEHPMSARVKRIRDSIKGE